MNLAKFWMNLAEWLERQSANAKVATAVVTILASILRHSGIRWAADEAELKKVKAP
jgi:hypothetical protein